MKTIMSISIIGLLMSAFGLGMSACAVSPDPVDEISGEAEQIAETEQALVTCTTNCSATGGPSITKTCTSCTANSSSITCDGVTTQCATLPPCATTCRYGVCSSCSDGDPSNCYVYNGCGHKYPIP